jgi:hypothetical protein
MGIEPMAAGSICSPAGYAKPSAPVILFGSVRMLTHDQPVARYGGSPPREASVDRTWCDGALFLVRRGEFGC